MKPRKDIPKLSLDKRSFRVTDINDDSVEIDFYRSASFKERLQHIERLRRLNYGIRATDRLQRIIRIVKCK